MSELNHFGGGGGVRCGLDFGNIARTTNGLDEFEVVPSRVNIHGEAKTVV